MASDKQIAANRMNAARSTGPRTKSGKERSSMNAFRHGLASRLGDAMSEGGLDLEALSDRLMRIEAERIKLIFEIESQIWEGDGRSVDILIRRLAALERYAQRCSSALRNR